MFDKTIIEIEPEHKRNDRLVVILERILIELKEIRSTLHKQDQTVTKFAIQENHMAITGIIPGSTGVFTATPLNAAGGPVTLPLPTVPVWTSSDPLATVTSNSDGLGASVLVDPSAPQMGSFTLTVAMADGSASTSVSVPYDSLPVDNVVASFGINQLS